MKKELKMKKKVEITKAMVDRMKKEGMTREECEGVDMMPSERNVYVAIESHWEHFRYGPSIDDLMRICEMKSRGSVQRIVSGLCKIGVCKRIPNKSRSVRPVFIRFRDYD